MNSDSNRTAIRFLEINKKLDNIYLNFLPNFYTAWTTITFFGESVKGAFDKATNETYYVEIPRLPIKSWYPWNAMSGVMYIVSFVFQVNKNCKSFN